jgi:hypothetical protein
MSIIIVSKDVAAVVASVSDVMTETWIEQSSLSHAVESTQEPCSTDESQKHSGFRDIAASRVLRVG